MPQLILVGISSAFEESRTLGPARARVILARTAALLCAAAAALAGVGVVPIEPIFG